MIKRQMKTSLKTKGKNGKKNREFAALDLLAIVNELQELKGARVKKVYQIENRVYLKLNKEKSYILVIGSDSFYVTSYNVKFPKQPVNFCMLLRKHLSNSKLVKIEQHEFDRIVKLDFQGRENRSLICEIFGNGNVILLNENGKIIMPMTWQQWRHRTLKPKLDYKYPPENLNPRELSLEEFSKILKESDMDLVRTLAIKLGFGGLYAEEICLRANVEKNKKCQELKANEFKKIHLTTQGLFQEVLTQASPNQILEKNQITDYAPIKLLKYSNLETKEFRSYNDACDEIFITEEVAKAEQVKGNRRAKYERILENQESTLEELKKNLVVWKKEADKLSTEHKFKEAGKLYSKIKKGRRKLPGLNKSIQQTKDKLESFVFEPEEEITKKKTVKKKRWYENFRYFISSDNFLVVAGKDASTNEILIKKHTEPKDIVFHASFPGAPFCVIKTQGKKVPTKTMRETAKFAASYSKAWSLGLGTADVYYVKPEQVSKKAPAGEFIGKGAFMIYGKKTHFKNVALELAIGVKNSEVIVGPESAVKSKTDKYVKIGPGNETASIIAKQIKEKLGLKQPHLETLQKKIPGGKAFLLL